MTNQLFINNEFVEGTSEETLDVINPATGETIDMIISNYVNILASYF